MFELEYEPTNLIITFVRPMLCSYSRLYLGPLHS